MEAPRDMGEKKKKYLSRIAQKFSETPSYFCAILEEAFSPAFIIYHEAVQSTAAVCDCEELLLFVAGTSVWLGGWTAGDWTTDLTDWKGDWATDWTTGNWRTGDWATGDWWTGLWVNGQMTELETEQQVTELTGRKLVAKLQPELINRVLELEIGLLI